MTTQVDKSRTIAGTILVLLFLLQVGIQLKGALSWGHDSWPLTDWLINYSGGFVRRGLAGEVIQWFSSTTGIQANLVVIAITLVCFIGLTAWLIKKSSGRISALFIISCMVMGMPAYQDSILRKDCFCLLMFLACLTVDSSHLPLVPRKVAVNLLGIIAVLIHETFLFYALPALVVFEFGSGNAGRFRELMVRGLWLMPILAAFLTAAVFHGNPETAQTVNDSWMPLWSSLNPGDPSNGVPDAAILALGWSSEEGLSPGINLLTSGFYQPTAWAALFGITFFLALAFTGKGEGLVSEGDTEARLGFTSILVTQLFFISPLFLLGHDYGRWLFFWVVSSLVIHLRNGAAPTVARRFSESLFGVLRLGAVFKRVPARNWYLLIIGIPVVWNIDSFILASPIGRHLMMLWSWFK
ncbi:hypothetical protein [Haloferula sp.]|uniref:hypothetical protein n=1 Tax=Haloferula sp. TaxID=2497595 RepID=UPI00329E012E